jgi:hypothetical protein
MMDRRNFEHDATFLQSQRLEGKAGEVRTALNSLAEPGESLGDGYSAREAGDQGLSDGR